jgi:hypothetical protein
MSFLSRFFSNAATAAEEEAQVVAKSLLPPNSEAAALIEQSLQLGREIDERREKRKAILARLRELGEI